MLDEAASRYQREGLDSEQQLAAFDLLQKETLKPKECEAIKQVAVEHLTKRQARNLLIEHWRDMSATQAKLRLEIENHLWANDLSNMGFTEADIANKVQGGVHTHLFAATSADLQRVLH